jgi:hypothetical protein
MADGVMGFASRLSMAAAGTAIGSYTEAHEFISESLAKAQDIVDTSGMRGTRSHPAERTRDGNFTVGGGIRYHATPALLDLLLPRINGANESTDVFALADTIPEFDVLVERVTKRFQYGGCKVGRATFRCTPGGILELDLDVTGKTETVSATAFPTITAPTDAPYVMSDAAFTMLSAAREVTSFELTIDNFLDVRFSNSQSATSIMASDRVVSCSLTVPYNSTNADLYGVNTGSAAAASFVFTNGTKSITFTIGTLQIPDRSPVISSKGEIFLQINGIAKMTGSTRELSITSDPT